MAYVTVLVENTRLEGRNDLDVEPGLSLHVQHNDWQILFDAGAKGAFRSNAEQLGIDVRDVEVAVLSHHHWDHGGGLDSFLQTNDRAKVYLRRNSAGECYFRAYGLLKRYTGLNSELFRKHASRLAFVDGPQEVLPGVFILTDIGNQYPDPKGNRYLFTKKGNHFSRDHFEHELIMVLREEGGLVVLTGCSHRGILNIVKAVCDQFPGRAIRALIGGFHLVDLPILKLMAESKAEVRKIGRELQQYPIDRAYTGHCTGAKAYRVLKGAMGEKLGHMPTGSRFEV